MAVAKKAAKKSLKKYAVKKAVHGSFISHHKPVASAPARPKINPIFKAGYVEAEGGLLVPLKHAKPVVVPPNKLRDGIEAAQGQIKKTLQGFTKVFTQDFEVSEIELSLSFNAEGKFLGFGAGGEMCITVKIVPS